MSSEAVNTADCLLRELKKHINLKANASILADLTRVKESSQCTDFWNYFEKHGGLKLLVQLLRYQDLKIINLALSILANACMNPDSREKVRNSDVAKDTVRILNLKVNDNLHCRACRLIGNLADCSYHAKAFCDAGVISKLSSLLNLKLNSATQLMAIRALRNIWSSHDESRQRIINSGAISKVVTIFVETEKKPQEQRYSDLSETCLKAMLAFISTNIECATQIEGIDSNGFRVLVIFCELHNKLAIKCLCKLASLPMCRPSLGNAGAVEVIVKLISNCLDYFADLVYCLYLFSFEAVNRHRIHACSGLQLILDLLKKKEHEKCHHLLLGSLGKFFHHEKGIYTMVDHGLIDVLAENFKRMTLSLEEKQADEKSPSKKRSRDKSPLFKTDLKYFRTSASRMSADYPRDDWSPKSTSSGACTPPYTPQTPQSPRVLYTPPCVLNRPYTPPYTPPNTPPRKYLDADFSYDNEEEIYSPVCSENEWSEDELQEEIESMKSFCSKSVEVEREGSQNQEKLSKASYMQHLTDNTTTLLKRLSFSENPIEKLADASFIGPVTSYLKLSKDKKVSQSLIRILQNPAYFLTLVKQSFVFEVHNLENPEDYRRVLRMVADTGGAEGELSSILLRGQGMDRFVIAVSIPYLIRSKEKLRKLLCRHGALSLIYEALCDNEHSLHGESVEAVCQLAFSLRVRPDVLDKSTSNNSSKSYDTTLGREVDYHAKPETVTLELDDGRTIETCRKSLCQRSEYFSNLLEGSFTESGKRRVRLKNVSKEGLEVFLLAVNGSTTFDDQEIDSLLDAVVLADQYQMNEISEKLTESSMFMLNHKNISKAWSWARDNNCQDLKTHCVKTFLIDNMTRTKRLAAFKDFTETNNFKEFLDEVKEIISAELETP